MVDTIVTINNTLELIGNRNLDELDFLYSIHSDKLVNHKMSDMFYLKDITFDDIKKFLESI